jgi:predicted RNA-binding Zn-ribbon protein involved in translation (DUF1610 family)
MIKKPRIKITTSFSFECPDCGTGHMQDSSGEDEFSISYRSQWPQKGEEITCIQCGLKLKVPDMPKILA